MAQAATDSESFSKGDHIVYPQHGTGVIVDIKMRELNGEEVRYLVVDFKDKDLRVWVPESEVANVGAREPIGEEEIQDLFELLSEHDVRIPQNFSRRYKNNQRRLNDGDIWQLAEVVRNLAIRLDRKHLSPSEKTMYEHARGLLIGELTVSLACTPEEAAAKLDELLPGGGLGSGPVTIEDEEEE